MTYVDSQYEFQQNHIVDLRFCIINNHELSHVFTAMTSLLFLMK